MHSALVVAELFCQLAKERTQKTGTTNDMTIMKLMKLIYIAHGIKLAATNRPLIADEVEAWTHGPVIPTLYRHVRRDYNNKEVVENIRGVIAEDVASLQPIDREFIEGCFNTHGKRTAWELSYISHDMRSPWYRIKKNINKLDNAIISDEDTKKYYKIVTGAQDE